MSVFEYLKSPTLTNCSNTNYNIKLIEITKIYFIYLGIAIIVGIFLKLIDIPIDYFFQYSILLQLKSTNQDILTRYGNYSLLYIVLLGPFLEEVIFRLPLKLEKIAIGISAGIICYRLLAGHILMFDFSEPHCYLKIVLALASIVLIAGFLPDSWLFYTKKYYAIYFYLIAIIFALVHLDNFESYQSSVIIFYPLFTLPQFVMALFIGYSRMELGFFYGVALHALINLTALLFSFTT